jgi:hypothetical protein
MSEDVKLRECPNPECVGCADIIYSSNGTEQTFCECFNCGTSGPVADGLEGAARLWNALPRHSTGVEAARVNINVAALKDAIGDLSEAQEYFEQRQDADCDETGFIPNEEMRMASRLEVVENFLSTLYARAATGKEG